MTASRPSLGKLSGSIRGISRIRASKPSRSAAWITPLVRRNSYSTAGFCSSGERSKSGNAGSPSGFLKSPLSATRNLLIGPASLPLLGPGLGLGLAFRRCNRRPDLVQRLLDGAVQRPDVARIADEVEPCLVERHAFVDGRDQAAGALAVLAAGLDHGLDCVGEVLVVELARNAERGAEIEVPDPQAVDAIESRDRFGVLDALLGLDLGEQGGGAIRRRQLVQGRPGHVAVVGDRERDPAPALGVVLHAVENRPRLLLRADHRQHDALGAHVGGPGDVVVLLGWDAHDGRQFGGLHVAEHALDRLETEAGVLAVEQGEVAPRRLENLADAGGGELDDEMAELEVATLGHVLEPWRRHGPACLPGGVPYRRAGRSAFLSRPTLIAPARFVNRPRRRGVKPTVHGARVEKGRSPVLWLRRRPVARAGCRAPGPTREIRGPVPTARDVAARKLVVIVKRRQSGASVAAFGDIDSGERRCTDCARWPRVSPSP